MERGGQVRSAVTNVNTNCFSNLGFDCLIAHQSSDIAVENNIVCTLLDSFGHAKGLQTRCAVFSLRIEFTLHHIKFTVDLRHSFFRFYKNQTIHTI
ncbi:hypothetical protein D3C72_1500760 [compost metagenome]